MDWVYCKKQVQLSIVERSAQGHVNYRASEDFAAIAENVPSVYMYLSAGYMDERGTPLPTTRRFGSMRTSAPSDPPAWHTAQSVGWKNIHDNDIY